jgi:NADH-quinone oxidoreductase subunit M
MTKRELAVLVPVVIFIIWIGVYPKPFLKPMEASVNGLIKRVEQRAQLSTSREDDTLTIKRSSPNQVRREPGRVG